MTLRRHGRWLVVPALLLVVAACGGDDDTDGTDAHFMDSQTYDQLAIPEDSVKESLKWIMPNEEIELLYVDESPSDIQVPTAVVPAMASDVHDLDGLRAIGESLASQA